MNGKKCMTDLGILPHNIAESNADRDYEQLSFTVKQLLRTMYNPATSQFEPLAVFGRYTEETGV